jgi:hypothetical protein
MRRLRALNTACAGQAVRPCDDHFIDCCRHDCRRALEVARLLVQPASEDARGDICRATCEISGATFTVLATSSSSKRQAGEVKRSFDAAQRRLLSGGRLILLTDGILERHTEGGA